MLGGLDGSAKPAGLHTVWGQPEDECSEGSSSYKREALTGVEWVSLSESIDTESSSQSGSVVDVDAVRRKILEGAAHDGSAEEDDGELPSKGSERHESGKCVPCHYFNTKAGCMNGKSCTFCHLHSKEARLRPCKAKRAKAKTKAGILDQSFHDPNEMQKVAAELSSQGGYLESVVKSKLRNKDKEPTSADTTKRRPNIMSL
mmetsp:Transcript_32678/g.74115  ORF Transcript_32678/g.74115 Transcript_32678/m.74115 type:complete len:202 (+) Transcript_32678:82-687(+)